MKTRILTETQVRRSWLRLLDLQRRGYTFLVKRRGKVIARLEAVRPTINRAIPPKEH
jgi:hypothetical protein